MIELLVTLSIVALLVAIVAPRYAGRVEQAEEAVLRQNLAQMREALDQYYADAGRYPGALEELVSKRYLRKIPDDPITKSSATWQPVAPPDPAAGRVYDVKSGAKGKGRNGVPYESW